MRRSSVLAAALVIGAVLGLASLTRSLAYQAEDVASVTVVRGVVAILRADGSVEQPAQSGALAREGDEVRTIGAAAANLTFSTGTMVELGADTSVAIDRISKQGSGYQITLKQHVGATFSHVNSRANPGSSYRIEAGGAEVSTTGTEFLLIGPTANGFAAFICLADCGPLTRFVGFPVSPNTGYYVKVEGGQVVSIVEQFKPDFGQGNWNAVYEALTMLDQQEQGDIKGIPAGQCAGGSTCAKKEEANEKEKDQQTPASDPVPSDRVSGSAAIRTPWIRGEQSFDSIWVQRGAAIGLLTTMIVAAFLLLTASRGARGPARDQRTS